MQGLPSIRDESTHPCDGGRVSAPQIRPHFDLVLRAPVAAVKARLGEHFAHGGDMWAGHIVGDHAQLVIRRKKRNIWSPWLTFAIEPNERGTRLSGRFAPHPSGWTLYLAAYGMVIISVVGLGFFGLSQWMAGLPATMLWSLPIGAIVLALLYGSAFVGQRLSGGEMDAMRDFVVRGLEGFEHEWVEPRASIEASLESSLEDGLEPVDVGR